MINKNIKFIDWENISFQIITYSGEGKSFGMMAIQLAKQNKCEEAKEMIKKAHNSMVEAEKAHLDVIQQEAAGVQHDFKVLFMHAEDQMLTAQTVIDLSDEMIQMYELIHKNC